MGAGGIEASFFTATGLPPKLLTRKDPELAAGAHFEVLVIALRGHTYQVECRMPAARVKELRPQLRAMLKSIRLKKKE